MKFAEKNDGGIELHIDGCERTLLFDALRHYSAYGKDENKIIENIPKICEMMNVLETTEKEICLC